MKTSQFITSIIIIFLFSISLSLAEDCNKFDKLSKDYAKCTSEKLKDKTSKKANELKVFTSEKINDGKKKFNSFKLKEKLFKFKNSKTAKEFAEK